VDVFLDYTGPSLIGSGFFNELLDVLKVFKHSDTVTSVSVFTWLDYPDVFLDRLWSYRLFSFYSLSWVQFLLLLQNFLVLDFFILFKVIGLEPTELRIVKSRFDMESHWKS
jgi:hypothetical protein